MTSLAEFIQTHREKAGLSNIQCHDIEPAIKTAIEAVRMLIKEDSLQ